MENVESRQLRRRLAGALLLCVFALSVIVWQTSPVIAASVTVLAVIVAFWMPSGARQRIPLQRLEALTEMKSVLLFDANGKVSWANDAFLDLLGASLDRLVGRSHDALFASIAQTTYQDLWQALCQGENSTGVYELVHSAGHTLWIRALLVPVMNKAGRLSHVVQYAVDISEQKKRAAQDVRVRSAFDNSNSCMMIADDDGSVIYMNDAMNALLVSAEDDLRKAYPWFDATKMLGINIDQFSIVSSQQSRSLSTTMQADWSLGDRSLRLSVNPVVDKRNDQRVGTLVEWQDRTHEFAAEREIQAVVDAARGGDLSRRIDPTGMHGFLRQFSDSVNELIQAVEQIFGETGSVLGALAQGDLTQRIEGDYAGRFLQLKSDINATVERLTDVLTQIKLASDWVKTGSSEISQGNTDLSQRTEEQGSSLEATAASMQSMTDAVRRNADSAAEANSLALASSAQAQRGGQVVNEAIAAMAEIDASSRKIGDIIGVIDEIAFQTNLLALNASVEAARAGEQGRGFAVVASEVRNLAGRSATAAREIKALIGDSGKKVNDGSRLVNQSGETLKQIVEGIQKVTQIVGDIASASQQQSSGIDKVNAEVSQMDKLTQQNAALVEQAAAASEAMGEQAESLDQLMAFFTVSGQRDLPVAQQSAKSEPATGDPLTTVPPLPPGGIERRAADRVWANSRVQKLANGVDDLGDGEQWSEF